MIEKDGNWNDRSWKKLEEKKTYGQRNAKEKGEMQKTREGGGGGGEGMEVVGEVSGAEERETR